MFRSGMVAAAIRARDEKRRKEARAALEKQRRERELPEKSSRPVSITPVLGVDPEQEYDDVNGLTPRW